MVGVLVLLSALVGAGPELVVRPLPRAETEPVPTRGDSADDPAVWVHPTDPARSLILGTNKQGGLHVYGVDGKELQVVGAATRPNNVDVDYDVPLGVRRVDLAVATVRAPHSLGIKLWRIDPDRRELVDVTAGGVLKVLGGSEPYGCCGYYSRKTGTPYFFVNAKDGRF